MKKALITMAMALTAAMTATAQNTPVSQMEKLDRGVVMLPAASGSGYFISWRFLGTDNEETTRFDILKDGSTIVAKNLYKTNYLIASATKSNTFQIITKVNGEPVDTSKVAMRWDMVYKPLTLDRPADGAQGGSYSPNDMSVGDVDGDGEYELFVKWDPSTSKDNSQNGITDDVLIDCYKLDGTKLWRINLGRNIRAGAHYTQFMVYDFDGDGRAEMMCKTAPGSMDASGVYVNQVATDDKIKAGNNSKSWITSSGRMDGGHEYLTVFNGLSGKAIHTIAYNPNRNAQTGLSEAEGTFNWAVGKTDNHGYNRGDRYLAAVAHLDGPDQPACGVFCRGYYTYAFVWAVGFDGQQLHEKWLHASRTATSYELTTYDEQGKGTKKTFSGLKPTSGSGSATMYSNGNHNLSVADVDGDGCDEIIWGSAACDNDGRLLYGTGFGHGDAIHLSDLNPDRPGLEVFQVHEEKGTYAWDVHDAATGEILSKGGPEGVDNGRGMAAQLDASHHGFYFSSASAREQRSAVTGNVASSGSTSLNFRIYWDGDLQDELLDGTKIDKWNGSGTSRVYINGKNPYDYNSSSSCNSTKATPNLQADILGDWREEIILWSGADNATINIFTSNTATEYRMPTLMHDHTYRMGICWQNTAYNQPPHLGYYLPDAMLPRISNKEKELTLPVGEEADITVSTVYAKSMLQSQYVLPDGTKKYGVPDGLTKELDTTYKRNTLKGVPTTAGDYLLLYNLTGYGNEKVTDTLTIHIVDDVTGIANVEKAQQGAEERVYDLQGRRQTDMKKGLFIVRRGQKTVKVLR